MKQDLLICTPAMSNADYDAALGPHFNLLYARTPEDQRKALTADWLKPVRAIYTTGQHAIVPELVEAMPNLEIVACRGTGYDAIDIELMNRKGIFLSYGAGANAPSVADHAMTLMLSTVRKVPKLDAAVRQGKWVDSRSLQPIATGKRLGILGMGGVGTGLAKRAVSFDMTVGYHTRNKRDVPYRYYSSVLELAKDSDILVACLPGGKDTKHIVNRAVLDALGPQGFFINVARGSVVDTDALIAALNEGRLAGAGLDVVDGEPEVPAALLQAPNVVITPHIGARSPEASEKAFELAVANLQAHFAGKPLLTPIPGSIGRRRAA